MGSNEHSAEALVRSDHPGHPANHICTLCAKFYNLGWVTGTGGGTSIRHEDKIYIVPSGVQKELMKPTDMFVMDFNSKEYLRRPQVLKPSACTPLFLAAFERGAGCCIHTHSQWAVLVTLLVERDFGKDACFEIEEIEQIKGIPKGRGKQGNLGYYDRLRIPIIENTAHEEDLRESLEEAMERYPDSYAILVRRHGIYVWGDNVHRAKTQCESIDYILQLAVEMKKLGLQWTKNLHKFRATLDDPTTINTWLPELAAKHVLTGYTIDTKTGGKTWQFEDKKGEITARMLLNHTYGGGYTYFNKLLLEYIQDLGERTWETTNEATDPYKTLLASPLLWQPGMHTNYGQGLDWVAVLIERITKQPLHHYLQHNIFDPLGLKEIGLEAAYGGDVTWLPHNAGKFWPRKMRDGGEFITIDPAESGIVTRTDAFPDGEYHTGCLGTGLVASSGDYTRLVSILLPQNVGVDVISGHRILSAESVTEICGPQLPGHLLNDSRRLETSDAAPIIVPVDLSAPFLDPRGSFGLGCGVQGVDRVLRGGKRGRGKGSVYWYGATNVEFWADGEEGIVVAVWGNYYPFCEEVWMDFVAGLEGIVYEGLERG